MVFDHGVDVETVYWHQVQVTELVRSGGDAEREGILRVHKQDAGRPVPSLDQGQEVIGIIGGQIETVDHMEIILRRMQTILGMPTNVCLRGCKRCAAHPKADADALSRSIFILFQ